MRSALWVVNVQILPYYFNMKHKVKPIVGDYNTGVGVFPDELAVSCYVKIILL